MKILIDNNQNVKISVFKNISTYALALFLFLTPFEYPLASMFSVSPLRLVGLFAMVVALYDIITMQKIKLDYRFISVFLWLAVSFFSYFWTIDTDWFKTYFSMYLNNAAMFLVFSLICFSTEEASFLKKSMIFGVGALLIYMTFVPGAVVFSQHRLSISGGDGSLDQNYLSALMLVSFGMVCYDLNNKKQNIFTKIISIVFCLAILVYILLTGSRSGTIASLVIIILTLNTSWKNRIKLCAIILLVVFVAIPLITNILPEELRDRFSLSAMLGQNADSGTRFVIWEKAISSLDIGSIIFGHGVGSGQVIIGDVLNQGLYMAPHNHYIAMILDTGIIGFTLINFPILKMIITTIKKDKGVGLAFVGICIMAFFIDVVTTKFFWSSLLLLSSCASCKKYKD